jgi:hypothetical protein
MEGTCSYTPVPIGIDDKIQWRCSCCGACCNEFYNDIILFPFDIIRISKHLGMTIPEFIKEHTVIFDAEHVSRIPCAKLKLPNNKCSLTKDGRCGIHKVKPTMCGIAPIGFDLTEDDKLSYILYYNLNASFRGRLVPISGCGEIPKEDEQMTVREWIDDFGIDIRNVELWFVQIRKLAIRLTHIQKHISEERYDGLLKDLYPLLYLGYNLEEEWYNDFKSRTDLFLEGLNQSSYN